MVRATMSRFDGSSSGVVGLDVADIPDTGPGDSVATAAAM